MFLSAHQIRSRSVCQEQCLVMRMPCYQDPRLDVGSGADRGIKCPSENGIPNRSHLLRVVISSAFLFPVLKSCFGSGGLSF